MSRENYMVKFTFYEKEVVLNFKMAEAQYNKMNSGNVRC